MGSPNPVIAVRNLSKTYGTVVGIENVSLAVPAGEIFGFLGPNGAGKTTLIRLLLDLLRPDSGIIEVFGRDIRAGRKGYKARIGNLPGEVSWWPALTGREILGFFARFRRSRPALQGELLARLGMDGALLGRRVRTYSRGMRRKLGLVVAMQHDPDLLILDEPTSGLDPLVRHVFFEICRGLAARGKTIFLSSHNLAETQEICNRAGIVRAGRLAALTDLQDLKAKSARRVSVSFARQPDPAWFDGLDGVEWLQVKNKTAHLASRGDPGPLLAALGALPVADISITAPSLDDLFLSVFSQEKESAPPRGSAAPPEGAGEGPS